MSFNPCDMLEVDCRRLHARLTRWGCRKRQLWSLRHSWDPLAMACWDCPHALPDVRKQAAPFLARIKSGRWCPKCGERERAVTYTGVVLALCPECLQRKNMASLGLARLEDQDESVGPVGSAVG